MGDFLTALFTGLWQAIVKAWNWLKGFFEVSLDWLGGVIIDLATSIYDSVVQFLAYVWDNYFYQGFVDLWNKVHALPFNQFLNDWEINSVISGNLVTAFVDVNLIVSSALAALLFLMSLAIFKFILKLIPTVG